MSNSSHAACRKNSWLAGLVGGILVAAMLFFVATYTILSSLLIGAVVAVLLGLFFGWAFCTGTAGHDASVSLTLAAPEPAAPPPPPEVTPPAPAVPEPARPEAAVANPKAVSAPAFITPPVAKPPVAAKPAPEAPAAPKPAARKPAKPRAGFALDAAVAKSKEPATTAGPELLTKPRGGKPDDLKQIKGVGPKLEKLLNDVGVWHFDQIASWKAKDIAIVDDRLAGFKGRISRDGWVKQAKVLAKGGTTEFSERVAKGGVY